MSDVTYYTYIQAMGLGFPSIECSCVGDGSIYENLVAAEGQTLPDKTTLDTWIAANPRAAAYRRITPLAFRNRFSVH